MATTHDGFAALRQDPEYQRLLAASARAGRDPLQVQAAGGNSSIKAGGAMWVKASGTWLADAETREIMVPVRQGALVEAMAAGPVDAKGFVPDGLAGEGLRPSIETTVHAVLPQRIVLHTHCVATIAMAMRRDRAALMADRLGDLDPIVVPYVMPGEPLARRLAAEAGPGRRVAILGNHGLVTMGD
ncbi:MAG: class II aldolase/adducin family protein, partial [Pseudomonadota bacterium]